jgi:hypothetical protein
MSRFKLIIWSLVGLMLPYHVAGAVGSKASLDRVPLQPKVGLYPGSMLFNCAVKAKKKQVSKFAVAPKISNPKSPSKEAINRRKLLQKEPSLTQRAWLYSAILPGLGQAYNGKYGKILVFYSGFSLAFGLAVFHHQEYQVAKRELIALIEQGKYGRHLVNYVEAHKRERNMYLFFAGLWYVINIFDAYVDGTLKTFDVSDNLEIIFGPSTNSSANQASSLGIDVSLNLKA